MNVQSLILGDIHGLIQMESLRNKSHYSQISSSKINPCISLVQGKQKKTQNIACIQRIILNQNKQITLHIQGNQQDKSLESQHKMRAKQCEKLTIVTWTKRATSSSVSLLLPFFFSSPPFFCSPPILSQALKTFLTASPKFFCSLSILSMLTLSKMAPSTPSLYSTLRVCLLFLSNVSSQNSYLPLPQNQLTLLLPKSPIEISHSTPSLSLQLVFLLFLLFTAY